jgi:hypothetical protein
MKLHGMLRHADLGTGVWVLETGDGKQVMLYGDVPKGLAGKQVEVEGRHTDAMGIGMVSDRAFEVSSIRAR